MDDSKISQPIHESEPKESVAPTQLNLEIQMTENTDNPIDSNPQETDAHQSDSDIQTTDEKRNLIERLEAEVASIYQQAQLDEPLFFPSILDEPTPSQDSPVVCHPTTKTTLLPPDSPTFSNVSKRKADLLGQLELDLPPSKKIKQDQADEMQSDEMLLEPPESEPQAQVQTFAPHPEIQTHQSSSEEQFDSLPSTAPLPFRKRFEGKKEKIVKTKPMETERSEKRKMPPQREIPKSQKEIPKSQKEIPKPQKETSKPQKQTSKPQKETSKSQKEIPKPQKEIPKPQKEISKAAKKQQFEAQQNRNGKEASKLRQKSRTKINTTSVLKSQGLVLDRSRPVILKGDWHHEIFSSC